MTHPTERIESLKVRFKKGLVVRKMEFDKLNSDEGKALKAILLALNHRNYRLFFGGRGISLIDTWVRPIYLEKGII